MSPRILTELRAASEQDAHAGNRPTVWEPAQPLPITITEKDTTHVAARPGAR